jgi:hypothetical protein
MTELQIRSLEQLRRRGYVIEYSRDENNGIIRVSCVRRLRKGILDLLIRPDGTYRDAQYTRWDVRRKAHTA